MPLGRLDIRVAITFLAYISAMPLSFDDLSSAETLLYFVAEAQTLGQ